jgi:hypothetical protein
MLHEGKFHPTNIREITPERKSGHRFVKKKKNINIVLILYVSMKIALAALI